MSQTLDHKETPHDDTLRRVLGLRPVRTVVFDGEGFLDPCPTCGHRAPADPLPELPPGDPVTDVPLDRAAILQAHRTVAMLVEVLDQRRPAKQLTDLVAPRVLRYLRAMPVETSGLRGGARLLSFPPVPAARGRGGGLRGDPAPGTAPGAGRVVHAGRRGPVGVLHGSDPMRPAGPGEIFSPGPASRRDVLARCAGRPRRAVEAFGDRGGSSPLAWCVRRLPRDLLFCERCRRILKSDPLAFRES
ncbi:hypothetical protein LWC35_11330 [Pseudonocardia kujensis]|uniref:hypothetical protein n=1 Tax=Pseudonocardia kujensis TaxID=1128675 RepID=UPI001E54B086|nr:hypothetical protein [Pseudonocardia kujensis]MCE0763490.1 hypothetical protein [Pseudonocardia kujensis]